MEFKLNGKIRALDADLVRARVLRVPPDDVRTHWVEIDGRRWPPKQAFRIALSLTDEPFISHFAVRIFRRLGFATSVLPNEHSDLVAPVFAVELGVEPTPTADEDSLAAYERLDRFFLSSPLTQTLSELESALAAADRRSAEAVLTDSEFDEDLIDSALIVRERVGTLDTLIHAAVITRVIPLILEDDERLVKRPSLGAGNDPDRVFDLETTHRVAEFKLSSWKGADGMRQRGLFADVVGLSLDETDRRRQVFVVGELPVRFLTRSNRDALKTLSKSSMRVRGPGLIPEGITVADFTTLARIEVIDLTTLLPNLR